MFLKYLKLTNGDNVIVSTDDHCDSFKDKEFIEVLDPVILTVAKFTNGEMVVETVTMQPWLKAAKRDLIKIPTNCIIVATDVESRTVEQYNKYISNYNADESEPEFDDEIDVEELLQSLLNEDSEETDNDSTRTRSNRTLH